MQRHAHQAGDTQHHADARRITQGGRLQRQIAFEGGEQRQAFLLVGHQIARIERALRAQHAGNTAEVPGAELAHRVIRVLTGDFLQRAKLLVHGEPGGITMIENIVSQHPQACRNGLRVPADHRFGVAALHQLLHLLRVMQADRDMLLQIQPHLEGAQQAFVFVVSVGRQHMQLLVTEADQIDHLLLAGQQRRQRFFRVGMLRQQGVFCFAIIGQLLIEHAQGFTQRLFAPHPEPEPIKQPVPEGAQRIEQ